MHLSTQWSCYLLLFCCWVFDIANFNGNAKSLPWFCTLPQLLGYTYCEEEHGFIFVKKRILFLFIFTLYRPSTIRVAGWTEPFLEQIASGLYVAQYISKHKRLDIINFLGYIFLIDKSTNFTWINTIIIHFVKVIINFEIFILRKWTTSYVEKACIV